MNRAYNHGSQGDFLTSELNAYENDAKKVISKAPVGTGVEIRNAARDGQIVKLESLVKLWKDDPIMNEGDEIGTTPLHTAASHGHQACVELLLKNGADKSIKNNVMNLN